MSPEVQLAIYAVVYVLTLFIGKGINLRNITQSAKDLTNAFNLEIAKPLAEVKSVNAELVKMKVTNTILTKELIGMYQERLEITNDPEEQEKLIKKINMLSELL